MKKLLIAATFAAAGTALIAMGLWAPQLIFQTLSGPELMLAGALALLAGTGDAVTFWRSARS
jgi:hypothetical protein